MTLRKRYGQRLGCTILRTSDGKRWRLRFPLVGPDGRLRRYSEDTGLECTPENRQALLPKARLIGAEIENGTFDYLRWFPESAHRKFTARPGPATAPAEASFSRPDLVERYYLGWIEKKRAAAAASPPEIRASLLASYLSHFRNHVLPSLGQEPFE
ncbi:MAG: Arm DNA-binding domain-containing protein, partial [Candidatus Binatia bacterium]